LNAFFCLSKRGQSGSNSFPDEKSRSVYECWDEGRLYIWQPSFWMWKIYCSNPLGISNFMLTLVSDCRF
jgi:hypothetical protein